MIDHRGAEVLLATAIDFALTPDEQATLDRHLAGCDRCGLVATQMRRQVEAMQNMAGEDAPSWTRDRVAAAAVQPAAPNQRVLVLLAAALMLAVTIGGAVIVGSGILDLDWLSINPDPVPRASSSPSLATPAASESALPSFDSSPTPGLVGLPTNTLIAYVENGPAGSSSIHTVEPNGANDRTLAEGSQPAWSPDGGSIAYVCPVPEDIGDICLMGSDGSGQAVLIQNAIDPRFSPDGSRLMFGRDAIDFGDTWIANADGSEPIRIGDGRGSWSPDGSWIMLETLGPLPSISVVRPDGTALRELGVGRSPAWSPDSRRILFTWNDAADDGSVQAFDVDSGSVETLLTPNPPVDQVAWVADHLIVGNPGDGLDLFNLATGDRRQLAAGLSIQGVLAPSPDGQWIAFNALELGAPEGGTLDIYIAPISGSGAARVAAGDSAVWRPAAVTVTFRLTLTGRVPADAAFAVEDGYAQGGQHAVYLCSYYGGYPACESGQAYDDVGEFRWGAQLTYRFWRELDANGATEEIESGELTAGTTDQVVPIEYAFPP